VYSDTQRGLRWYDGFVLARTDWLVIWVICEYSLVPMLLRGNAYINMVQPCNNRSNSTG
jgi:hypothetical protein